MTSFSSGYGKPKYTYTTTEQARKIALHGGGKSTPAAPVVAPAPPAVGAPTPDDTPAALPVDPIYDDQVGIAQRVRDDTVTRLKQQRDAGLLNYGYQEQDNPDGTVASLNFDATNPYSQAALLKTHYTQAKTGTKTSLAAQGQLYSGALNNAQNQNDSLYNQSDDALQKAVLTFLANNTIAKRDALGTTYDTAVAQAGAGRLARAPGNPNYSDAAPTPAAPAAAAPAPVVATVAPTKRVRRIQAGKVQYTTAAQARAISLGRRA